MANELVKKITQTKIIRNIVEKRGHIENDTEKCVYCGKCQNDCPVEAISVERSEKVWRVNSNVCIRCERCVKTCPKSALSCKK